MTVRMLNDENRFYIVLENPTNTEKLKAMALVQELFHIDNEIKEEKPIGVLPTKVEEVAIPENAREVSSEADITKQSSNYRYIPQITKPEMFVEYYLQYDQLDEGSREWLLKKCAWFMKNYLKKINSEDFEMVKGFLNDFSPVLKNTISAILTQKGYSNLKGFLNTAGEQEIASMYEQCKIIISKGLKI